MTGEVVQPAPLLRQVRIGDGRSPARARLEGRCEPDLDRSTRPPPREHRHELSDPGFVVHVERLLGELVESLLRHLLPQLQDQLVLETRPRARDSVFLECSMR